MEAMKHKFRVVWLRDDTAERVHKLMQEAFPEENWKLPDLFNFCHKRSENVFKVLMYGHRVLGCLLTTIDRKKCRIRRLAVFKHYRRRGYARLLVKTLVSSDSPLRRVAITATVHEEHLAGQQFFRDCKFDDGRKFVFDPKNRHRYDDGRQGYVFTFATPLRPLRTIRKEKRS